MGCALPAVFRPARQICFHYSSQNSSGNMGFQNCATPRILRQWFGGQANKGILGFAVPTHLKSIRLEKDELIYVPGSAIRMSKHYWTLIRKWAAGIFHLGDQHSRKEPSGGDQLNSSYPKILKRHIFNLPLWVVGLHD